MRRWVYPIFLACTLLLLLPVGLTAWTFLARSRSFAEVQQTKDIQLQVSNVLSQLQDAETAQRGFLLSGTEEYLQPYLDSEGLIPGSLATLRAMTQDDAEQQRRLDALEPLVRFKLQELRDTIALRREAGLEAALKIVTTDEGRRTMDRIRVTLQEVHRAEDQRLTARMATLNQYSLLLVATMAVAVVLIVAAAGVSAIMISREMRAREEALHTLNRFTIHLHEANEALSLANGELQHFAYVASHDLQEPLRSISGYVQLLARRYSGQLDEKALGYIDKSVAATKRMQVLIENLLMYSRIANAPQHFEPVETNAVVADALVDLDHRIHSTNATIECASLPDVQGDRAQLTQLFRNLVGNALKFRGEAPPVVHIEFEQHGDFSRHRLGTQERQWRFRVRDNGIGFDTEHAERIFLMFQRLHTRQEYAGTGIGLAICRKIVERHGGRIWAEAEPGAGATFCFTLPAAKE